MASDNKQILFEKFEILSCLKKDTNTGVYIANHIYLNKKILLKTLNQETLGDESVLLRFQREAKILAKLDHPNIINVLDFGTFQQFFYISFEYFDSRNLRQVLQQDQLTANQKSQLVAQMLQGLAAAHNQKIIHRDIKPENILVGPDFLVKIADFGLALAVDDSIVTKKSSIVGTPGYMSPEQIRGEKLTLSSDLFSAGIVAFEIFIGENPFIGRDVSATLNNILNVSEDDLAKDLAEIPEPDRKIISNLLMRDKSRRINLAGEEPSPANRVQKDVVSQGEATGKNKKVIYLVAISAIILILSLVTRLFNGGPKNETPEFSPERAINSERIISSDSLAMINNEKPDEVETKNDTNAIVPPKETVLKEKKSVTAESDFQEIKANIPGKLFIQCSPWADVYIDSQKVETTPIEDPIRLFAGEHTVTLIHPQFPAYTKTLSIQPMETHYIKVSLDTLFGFLDCRIYPWGDIYINQKHIGQSPFQKPIGLMPGDHVLTVKNPAYDSVDEYIHITQNDTLLYKLNFQMLVKSKGKNQEKQLYQ